MISIYDKNIKVFSNNGIKIIHPIEALIRKEDNGDYYLTIRDYIKNISFFDVGKIIVCDTPWGRQGFRIDEPEVDDNYINYKCWHLYYDSKNYIVRDSYAVNMSCNSALDHFNSATDIPSPFIVSSDISDSHSMREVRKSMYEVFDDVIERWGGHLVRNNFNVSVNRTIGQNNNVVLSTGKNITFFEREENWENVCTKILPVGKDGLLLPEYYLSSEEQYEIPYTKVIKFEQNEIIRDDYETDEDYNAALLVDLRAEAEAYLVANHDPVVTYCIDSSIKGVSDIGDSILVKNNSIDEILNANVTAVEYDCISEQFTRIEFGNFKKKLNTIFDGVNGSIEILENQQSEISNSEKTNSSNISTINNQIKNINDRLISESDINEKITQATSDIMAAFTNSYVITEPNQILIVDTLPKESATNVIRINANGIGLSQSGINGTFKTAITISGELLTQNINVLNFTADLIKGGTLKLGGTLNQSGTFELYDSNNNLISLLDRTGITVYCTDGSYVKLNPNVGLSGYDSNNTRIFWVDRDEFNMKKSVVEKEITLASKLRMIPMTTSTNTGIAFVALV